MPVSFAQAVDAVRTRLVANWAGTMGTPFVASGGYADAADFLVVWGTREYLRDGEDSYALVNNTVTFVDRITGVVRDEVMTLNFDKVAGMEPVSA